MRVMDISGRGGTLPVDRSEKGPDGRPHAVVIGSGFGGLAAAVRLGARGYRVTVLEKLDAPGGRASVFRQDGFVFDAGPTIVTAPFLFEDLWTLCGKRFADDVTLRAMDPFYRIRFHDGSHFDYCGDPDRMRAEVARFSPDDVAGYERFQRETETVFRIGFEELGHVPFGRLSDMLRVLPDLVRLGGHRSVYGMVAKYLRDPRLRVVFSFHPLLVGGNPFSVTSVYTLINHLERKWGVHFAMGGTNMLVRGLAGLIAGQGNRIRCNAEVARILLDGRRATGVRLADGEIIAADVVVSNADTAWTYKHLLPQAARKRWRDRSLERASYSNGLFVWYFGTDRRYDEVLHHTILLGPRYRGLIRDIFRNKTLSDDFSLYLHRPTATDPSLAPQGCDAFYVLSPVPHLDSGTDWSEAAESYRRRIEAHLEETLLPGLRKSVVSQRMMTPADFETRLLSYKGAGFGMEPRLTQSAWFRPHNASEDIERLYIVGAGTHPGAGLPGVLSSARILDEVVPNADALV
ncbi:phytoene desaturase [Algihabitans sp.]|uniref:phytoene desaturase n=1 Tax=Algihabitans sp. TaxID=2821514 RepID=UPI003BAD2C9A